MRRQSVIVDVLPAGASGGGALSADGSVITATVLLKGDVGERQKASASLNEHLAKDMPAGINAAMAGNSPLMGDLTEVEGHDMMTAEMVGLPLAFIVLLLAQRSVLAAMMPMVLGMCAVGVTLGLLSLSVSFMDWNVFVESFVAMMGLAIGIDYSLLIVRRYREELSAGMVPPQAIVRTLETAGRTALFSGMIVVISLVAMAVTGLPFYADSAIGVILVVLVLLTGAPTLLPALLLVVPGDRLDRGRLRHAPKRLADNGSRWERWARAVMRRPGAGSGGRHTDPAGGRDSGAFRQDRNRPQRTRDEGRTRRRRTGRYAAGVSCRVADSVEVLVRSPERSKSHATQRAREVLSHHNNLGPAYQTPLGPDASLLVVTPTVTADSLGPTHSYATCAPNSPTRCRPAPRRR